MEENNESNNNTQGSSNTLALSGFSYLYALYLLTLVVL